MMGVLLNLSFGLSQKDNDSMYESFNEIIKNASTPKCNKKIKNV